MKNRTIGELLNLRYDIQVKKGKTLNLQKKQKVLSTKCSLCAEYLNLSATQNERLL